MFRRFISLLALSSLLFVASFASATDYSSTNFKVNNPVIEELGGFGTSTSFKLWGSIPYISPVRTTSTSYGNNPGFLGFPGPSPTPTPSPSPSPGGGPFLGGYQGIPKPEITEEIRLRVDFNRDGKVDFIDFSILLYYFDKTGARIIPFDLNDDGAVDMVDISIFMYYWDGN